jgi:sec-independent protein translocase protein TatA
MGLDNPLHIAFLLILLLLVFGAKRLPEMGRSLGSGMRGFKDSLSGEHEHEHSSLVASAEQHAAPAATPAVPVAVPAREPVIGVVREPGTPVA